jgi:glycosyltransferase involved in cell wall biosynthesis
MNDGLSGTLPLVSCIMPTANRREFVPGAIRMFLAQDYPNKELVILDDGLDCIADIVPSEEKIRYIRHPPRASIGRKRNLACIEARGEIIAHWDDDDWYASRRLSLQVEAIQRTGALICGLNRVFFFDQATRRAWEYVYPKHSSDWVYGATLCYHKSVWRKHPFHDVAFGEDTYFVAQAPNLIHPLSDTSIFVGLIHAAARGSIIVHWDDGDWYGPKRLSAQIEPLVAGRAEVSALVNICFFK